MDGQLATSIFHHWGRPIKAMEVRSFISRRRLRSVAMPMMRAAVLHQPGPSEAFKIESIPPPEPTAAQVLIRVRAFGINRSELFTRRGDSPNVTFPRVLGIEAVGEVEAAPGRQFKQGETVATVMGGMGRRFDGGYAEYTCVPANQVQAVRTKLGWETLGALPEMLQTAWGSLLRALRLAPGERLLVRGGTTSVGLAAAAIAKAHGGLVISTTRNPAAKLCCARQAPTTLLSIAVLSRPTCTPSLAAALTRCLSWSARRRWRTRCCVSVSPALSA
jgi:D-arabinose 1-dehydrogenase-like Zn-dependent alcohol dehydrogenase